MKAIAVTPADKQMGVINIIEPNSRHPTTLSAHDRDRPIRHGP